jgi:hypothetical protein
MGMAEILNLLIFGSPVALGLGLWFWFSRRERARREASRQAR